MFRQVFYKGFALSAAIAAIVVLLSLISSDIAESQSETPVRIAFYEDFNDGELYNNPTWQLEPTYWSIINGQYHAATTYNVNYYSTYADETDDFLEISFTGALKRASPEGQAILISFMGIAADGHGERYDLAIEDGSSHSWPVNHHSIGLRIGAHGTISDIIASDFVPSRDTLYNVKAVRQNGIWSLFANDDFIGSTADPLGINQLFDVRISMRGSLIIDNIVVRVPGHLPSVSVGGPYTGYEGSGIAIDDVIAIDEDGEVLTYSWSVDDHICVFDDTTILNPTLTCGDNGSYLATLTVSDGVNEPVSSQTNVIIHNVTPSIENIHVPAVPISIGDQSNYNVTVEFTDPAGTNDEYYVCDFDLESDGAIDQTLDLVTGSSCSVQLAYDQPGVYLASVTVTDKDGGSSNATAPYYIVIYDPLGGFVTGGGWIWSEAGSCFLDEACFMTEGKANFGFVSKYKKGASVPEGSTEFQFKAGNLNFHSQSYDWLVIAGSMAKYKGVGTVNGSGEFGFMVAARDGDLEEGGQFDGFRIKIWDKLNGDQVIYDNKPDDGDDSSEVTYLGGGNIVIHKSK